MDSKALAISRQHASDQGLLCVCVQAPNTKTAMKKVVQAGAVADLVELRLDLIPKADIETLVRFSPVPVIATVRSRGEGGAGNGHSSETVSLLLRALEAGAACVDVEMALPREVRREMIRMAGPERVILSRHIVDGTPSSHILNSLLERMAALRPAVIKIVCRACAPEDNHRVLALIPRARSMGLGITAFCMGRMGAMSRLRSLRMGATLGYAAMSAVEATADGQIPIEDMRRLLKRSRP